MARPPSQNENRRKTFRLVKRSENAPFTEAFQSMDFVPSTLAGWTSRPSTLSTGRDLCVFSFRAESRTPAKCFPIKSYVRGAGLAPPFHCVGVSMQAFKERPARARRRFRARRAEGSGRTQPIRPSPTGPNPYRHFQWPDEAARLRIVLAFKVADSPHHKCKNQNAGIPARRDDLPNFAICIFISPCGFATSVVAGTIRAAVRWRSTIPMIAQQRSLTLV